MEATGRNSEEILDAFLGYITSPIFHLPVLSFIEENCLIFNPGTDDSPKYREIHATYKNLINLLIESFQKDTGMKDEDHQFFFDCMNKPQLENEKYRHVIELIFACDDYQVFVRIMIQKNLNLQQEALMMIAQTMGGSLPQSLVLDSKSQSGSRLPLVPMESEDDKVLKAVLATSKAEYEQNLRQQKKEDDELKTIMAMSKKENERIQKTMKDEQEKLNDLTSSKHKIGDVKGQVVTGAEAASAWLKSAEAENSSDNHSKAVQKAAVRMAGISEEEHAIRSEFLRNQRDKLMMMKKKEREKQLLAVEKSQPKRPASARAAHAIISQNIGDINSSSDDDKKLAMRKSLAARLKSEVIAKK